MKKYITIAGGALTVISLLLPFTSVMGVTVNGMKMGGAAWFYIACGIAAVITGYMDKRKFYPAVIVTGLLITGLAMKYQSDLKSLGGASVEFGLWVLLLGGLLTLTGGIMGVLAKKRYVNRVA
jgi:hypothetical protein